MQLLQINLCSYFSGCHGFVTILSYVISHTDDLYTFPLHDSLLL